MKRLGRNYWFLWSGYSVSTFGTYLSMVIINLFIYQMTGSPFLVGLFFLFRLIPAFFMGNLAGFLADRYDRRVLIIAADICRAVLIFSVIFLKDDLYPLYFIIFGIAVCDRLYQSAIGGALPNIVGGENLLPANSYLSAARTVGLLSGPILGGVFASMKAYGAAFSIDAATYLFSAAMFFLINAKFQVDMVERSKASMWDGIKSGYGFVLARAGLLSIILIRCLDAFGSAALNISIPVFSSSLGQLTPGLCYGLIYAAFGSGEVLGAMYLARKPFVRERPPEAVIGWSILLMALFFGIALGGPNLFHTMFFIFLSAAMEGVTCVTYNIYLQRSPDAIRGRIVGTSETGVWTSMGIGMFVAGIIAEKVNIAYVVQGFAALIIVGSMVHLFCFKRRQSAEAMKEAVEPA